jgi:phenylpyruvate tautomerase PptA (4-oxalocrotonate tautomerase family)
MMGVVTDTPVSTGRRQAAQEHGMAQVKVYGIAEVLNPIKTHVSDVIHSCVVDALQLPQGKRAHRFFLMDAADFFVPEGQGRSEHYTIIEISLFEGRSVDTRKHLIMLLFERLQGVGLTPADVEITITETPRQNWGFRGQTGDEVTLDYKVDV